MTLSSTLNASKDSDSTTVGGNNAFELQRPTDGSGHGTALSIMDKKRVELMATVVILN